jgi:hypothetical protein
VTQIGRPRLCQETRIGSSCLVVSDFGRHGRAWRETDVEATDLETVIQDLLDGQYSDPVSVVSFNTGEGWARDISADVAEELRRRCELEMREVPSSGPGLRRAARTVPASVDAARGLRVYSAISSSPVLPGPPGRRAGFC